MKPTLWRKKDQEPEFFPEDEENVEALYYQEQQEDDEYAFMDEEWDEEVETAYATYLDARKRFSEFEGFKRFLACLCCSSFIKSYALQSITFDFNSSFIQRKGQEQRQGEVKEQIKEQKSIPELDFPNSKCWIQFDLFEVRPSRPLGSSVSVELDLQDNIHSSTLIA